MNPSEFTMIRYTVERGTARIVLDRPDRHNAFTANGYAELGWAVRHAKVDPAVDTLVLTGTGSSFASGGDLSETLELLENDDPLAMYAFIDSLPWMEFRECPKVIIGAINGLCMGGGLIGALSCDIAIAAESATFACAEGRVGVADRMIANLLHGRIGTAAAKYLLLTGAEISAAEAGRLGLVHMVTPDDELETAVAEVIALVRRTTPRSRQLFKSYVDELLPPPLPLAAFEALSDPSVVSAVRSFVRRAQ